MADDEEDQNFDITPRFVMLIIEACVVQIFRKEPFFYGHDNYDQLVKIAKVCGVMWNSLIKSNQSHSDLYSIL